MRPSREWQHDGHHTFVRPGSRATGDGGVRRHPVWHDTADPAPHGVPLSGDITADVAIVGRRIHRAWAAYYLTEAAPSLRVLIVEVNTESKPGATCGLSRLLRRSMPDWRTHGMPSHLTRTSEARRPRCGGSPVFRRARARRNKDVTATPSFDVISLGGVECSGSGAARGDDHRRGVELGSVEEPDQPTARPTLTPTPVSRSAPAVTAASTTPPQDHPPDAAVAAPVAVGGAAARSDGR
jgi:hypothetical protein